MTPRLLVTGALIAALALIAGGLVLGLRGGRDVDPAAALARAREREAAGDLEGAAAAYEAALDAGDGAVAARAGLGRIRFRQARYADAVPLLQTLAAQGAADPQQLIDLGTALLRLDRNAEAVAALGAAVAADPGSAPAHNNLGVALARLGRFDEAAVQFERVLQIDPTHRTAARSLDMARNRIPGR